MYFQGDRRKTLKKSSPGNPSLDKNRRVDQGPIAENKRLGIEEEHATIASQAKREGLGVDTYLRALALRTAFEASPSPRGRAFRALREIQEQSKARGPDKLSAKEIEAEIKAARATRHRR